MTITPQDYAKSAGIPSQWSDTIAVTAEGFVTGDKPEIFSEDMTIAINQTFIARQAVGLDGTGDLIPAVFGVTPAVGFVMIDVANTGAGAKKSVPVWRGGCFSPDLAVFDASYNTPEKKLEAFRAAASPTQIVMRGRKTATPILP
jgi:hypothetical protein